VETLTTTADPCVIGSGIAALNSAAGGGGPPRAWIWQAKVQLPRGYHVATLDAVTGTVRGVSRLAGALTGASAAAPGKATADWVRAHAIALGPKMDPNRQRVRTA
jgi:hypothetical protein